MPTEPGGVRNIPTTAETSQQLKMTLGGDGQVVTGPDESSSLLQTATAATFHLAVANFSTSASGHSSSFSDFSDYVNATTATPTTAVADDFQLPYSYPEMVLIAIVAGFLSLLTVAGNCMVMISFKIDKQLQTISNYFLFSLAVADFAIGLISMPLFTVYTLAGRWQLGPQVCDTWLSLDYLASNASVLNLLIISFDRYLHFTHFTHFTLHYISHSKLLIAPVAPTSTQSNRLPHLHTRACVSNISYNIINISRCYQQSMLLKHLLPNLTSNLT